MNPSVATLFLVLLAGALFTLPLLPAIAELLLKRDAQPLNVIQQHAGEVRHFANGFRSYIAQLQPALQECVTAGTNVTGRLPGGEEYLLVGRPGDASFTDSGKKQSTCPRIVVVGSDVIFPPGITFAKEIYVAGRFAGGERNSYRAILGEGDILLDRESKVMRWAHAVGKFQVERDCDLYGRISSDQEIQMHSGCTFQRLNAPCIRASAVIDWIHSTKPELYPGAQFRTGTTGRRLFEEDLEIRPGDVIIGDVVTRGKLHIGAGARIIGSVKSNKDAVLEGGVSVKGNLISAARMHIGHRCRITGLVIGEHELVIEAETACGTIQMPTTVSAPIITLEVGAVVFGTLWARDEGRVVAKA